MTPSSRKIAAWTIVASAAFGALLVVSLFAPHAVNTTGSGENLPIGGVGHITVYNAQGKAVETWTGHNELFPQAEAAIANCLSGAEGPANEGLQGCNYFTQDILVGWTATTAGEASCPASAALQAYQLYSCVVGEAATPLAPPGCGVGGLVSNACTGWDATATFPSTDFTASNGCAVSCTVTLAIGLQGSTWTGTYSVSSSGVTYTGGNGFDILSPTITLAQGDSLQITIAYSIT